MSYYFSRSLNMGFNDVMIKVSEELQREGFGILTEINVKETLKKKLDVDFRRYKILGVCHPPSAYKALMAEDKIGLMLPCNIIVQEISEDQVEVAAIDPEASMQAIKNNDLAGIAREVKEKLARVMNHL